MSLVFHFAPMSTATTVHWALEELGIPYEKAVHSFKTGELSKPDYLAINPNGLVPCIVHDGTVVWESVAIIIHLGEVFGVDRGVFPAPGVKRGDALKWLVWSNVSLGEAVRRWQLNTSDRVPADERNAKAGEKAKGDLHRLLGILDAQVQKTPYVTGATFTLADLHLAAFVWYTGVIGIDLKPHANVQAWLARCTDRPSYARTMAAEQAAT